MLSFSPAGENAFYQAFAISYQLSAFSFQLSAISYQLSAFSFQLSAISFQLQLGFRGYTGTMRPGLYMFLLAGFCNCFAQAPKAPNLEVQRAAMKKLEFMIG